MHIRRRAARLLRGGRDDGQTNAELGLVLSFVTLALVVVAGELGAGVTDVYQTVTDLLDGLAV